MTVLGKRKHKLKLHQIAVKIIRDRIAEILISMENAQESANNEEKSSAGDKYETSRAMNQNEKDMHSKQLAANNLELATLLSIDCNSVYHSVKTGCVVTSNGISFFIAAGLGKINFEGSNIYFLSPGAAFAKSLLNKVAGDRFIFNNEQRIIEDVY